MRNSGGEVHLIKISHVMSHFKFDLLVNKCLFRSQEPTLPVDQLVKIKGGVNGVGETDRAEDRH